MELFATDRFGKVTEFNAQAQEILGWSKEEVLGTLVQKLYAEGEAQRIGRLLHDSRTGRIVTIKPKSLPKMAAMSPFAFPPTICGMRLVVGLQCGSF